MQHDPNSDIKSSTADYLWARIGRAQRKFADALILFVTKTPDPRVMLALLDRIDPKPKYSKQTLSQPIELSLENPTEVEATRQRILTLLGSQQLPIEEADAVMKIVNDAGDRSVMADIEALFKAVEDMRNERMSNAPTLANHQDVPEDGVIGESVVSGEVVKVPTWGIPTNHDKTPPPDTDPDPDAEAS